MTQTRQNAKKSTGGHAPHARWTRSLPVKVKASSPHSKPDHKHPDRSGNNDIVPCLIINVDFTEASSPVLNWSKIRLNMGTNPWVHQLCAGKWYGSNIQDCIYASRKHKAGFGLFQLQGG